MAEIVSQVQRFSQRIGEISGASAEKSTGISQVREVATQQSRILLEENAATAESLRHHAPTSAHVVSVFSLAAPSPEPRWEANSQGDAVKLTIASTRLWPLWQDFHNRQLPTLAAGGCLAPYLSLAPL